jgi:hypothetical protein
MPSKEKTTIHISPRALRMIAENGGHATIFLEPRPPLDG